MAAERSLGHYRLVQVLGTGTFATVWLAHDVVLDRPFAIKVLADNWSRDHDVRRRFLSEARVLLTAESPRITRGFQLGETDDGRPYLVMTWAERGTLADRIAGRRRRAAMFAAHEAASIVQEVALGVADVHALGHLHRDVKPSNVLIRSSQSAATIDGLAAGEQLVIGDFGLARGIDASAITMIAGSPGYVAPEQAAGLAQLDRRADVFPLGRILLELLTGDSGGRATTMAGAADERIDATALLAEHRVAVPRGFVDLIDRLLSVDPARRPPTAVDVARELQVFTDADVAVGVLTPPSPPDALAVADAAVLAGGSGRQRSALMKPRVLIGGAAAALVLGIAFVGVRLADDDDDPPAAQPTILVTEPSTASTPGTLVETSGAPSVERRTLGLPSRAAIDRRASDDTRTVATVALSVDEVVEFYEPPPEPWVVESEPSESGDGVRIELTDGSRLATVTVTPAAVTAGAGISRIVIDYEP